MLSVVKDAVAAVVNTAVSIKNIICNADDNVVKEYREWLNLAVKVMLLLRFCFLND